MNAQRETPRRMPKGTVGRKERFRDARHDTYQARKKWPQNTCCPDCGAAFVGGRWAWASVPRVEHAVRCPACQRMADRYPAGFITLRGPFVATYQDALRRLIFNVGKAEMNERPLERLMDVETKGNTVEVTTTGVHLARRIGQALHRAFDGDLNLDYADGQMMVRVTWVR
ncbi:MAG: BCAM0308 family protein [Bacteroidota bacterium]